MSNSANDYKLMISESGNTIYDTSSSKSDPLYIPTDILTEMLADGLIGMNLVGLPLRTRSKIVKSRLCEILGYPIPKTFTRTQPRFLAQNFDVYIQKSMNVQIWNEEIDSRRRYVFIKVSNDDIITSIKIINGDQLAELDKTGTLTGKYQATMSNFGKSSLFSSSDTKRVAKWCTDKNDLRHIRPNDYPKKGQMFSINEIFQRLSRLEGRMIPHLGYLQERNRAAELHQLVCESLGYTSFDDDGTYPDIMNQLIEIKLQTSQTIDLGLHSPDDKNTLFTIDNHEFRSRDIRYVIVDGFIESSNVFIQYVHVVNGRDFSKHFPLFGGNVKNTKLQIKLPVDFFN